MNKKKFAVSAVAIAAAASMLLGGTFAWQSISQTALNEKEEVINPGGRLHDDFNGKNKDVYVENFADNDIYARVRLDEYFEITMNKGVTDAEKTEVITTGATKDDTSTYITHKFDAENTTGGWWNWTTGGSTTYMPTFNKNKDSLKADINGTFENDYEDYVTYTEGDEVTGDAVYDNDSNSVEDDGVTKVEETHVAAATGTGTLISMDDWLKLADEGKETGNYWVYDSDGWVYWSSPIKAGEASGLLLDEISLKEVMDDSYYYAINVVGQFITKDDLGKDDNTGFYDTSCGAVPSDNALKLLEKIGVEVGKAGADDTEDDNAGGNDDTDNSDVAVEKIQDYCLTLSSSYYSRYNYYTEHEPDFSKIILLVTYENGNTEKISATDEGVTFTPKDQALVSGQDSYDTFYIYTATYKGVSCEIKILAQSEGGDVGGGMLPSGVYNEI